MTRQFMTVSERVQPCSACDGRAGLERVYTDRYPRENGDPFRSWEPCIYCDGTGETIVVTSLATSTT